jgi:hypothetical protein
MDKNNIAVDYLTKAYPEVLYHSQPDLIWPDRPFKCAIFHSLGAIVGIFAEGKNEKYSS